MSFISPYSPSHPGYRPVRTEAATNPLQHPQVDFIPGAAGGYVCVDRTTRDTLPCPGDRKIDTSFALAILALLGVGILAVRGLATLGD